MMSRLCPVLTKTVISCWSSRSVSVRRVTAAFVLRNPQYCAVVHACAGYVERRKQNNSIAVDRLFDPIGGLEDRRPEFRIVHVRERRNFRRRQQFARACMIAGLLDDIEDRLLRWAAILRQGPMDLGFVDEIVESVGVLPSPDLFQSSIAPR